MTTVSWQMKHRPIRLHAGCTRALRKNALA